MKAGVPEMEDSSMGVSKVPPPIKSSLARVENTAMDYSKLMTMKSGMLDMESAPMGYNRIPGMGNSLFPENLSLQQLVSARNLV